MTSISQMINRPSRGPSNLQSSQLEMLRKAPNAMQPFLQEQMKMQKQLEIAQFLTQSLGMMSMAAMNMASRASMNGPSMGMGSLSATQREMISNAPAEMKPFLEAQMRMQSASGPALIAAQNDMLSKAPAEMRPFLEAQFKMQADSGRATAEEMEALGVGGMGEAQKEMIATAPKEMRPFLVAQMKMQKEQEITQFITQMLKQMHEMSMGVIRNIGG